LHVRHAESVVCEKALGTYTPGGLPVDNGAIFDLASLTKLFVSTALLVLFDRRAFSLDDALAGVIPEFGGPNPRRGAVTFRQLLTHTSGLPAHVDFRDEPGREAIIARVCAMPLAYTPGTRVVYSDLGFMLAGEALMRLSGLPLQDAVRTLVLEPLDASSVGYKPPRQLHERIVATEDDAWRGLLRGQVHDENCWAMGAVSGHAGLFGCASDVAQLGRLYRGAGAVGPSRILLRATANAAIREQACAEDERRGLGWALKSGDHLSCGAKFSWDSFGHTGYTGTSLWVDPQRALIVALLTNRVQLTRDPEPIRALRAAVNDAVVKDIESAAGNGA
jgi:CubicO group peptidase (beta-lactamase class C family)